MENKNDHELFLTNHKASVALAGQTRGAIGLSLIFCFFCIKTKEKRKTLQPSNLQQVR